MGDQSDRIAAKLARGVENTAKAFVLRVDRELKLQSPLGTPVQTGNARANWIPSAGAPSTYEGDSVAGAAAAAAQGAAQVAAWKLGQGDLYETNRTPYIRFLNDGSSTQSPALFVEAAIERAKTWIRENRGVDFGGIGLRADQSAADVAGEAAENLASAYSPFGGGDD